MSQANVYEQYFLELINAERAAVGAQPLAFDSALNNAAEQHSAWMIASDIFSHTGINTSDPGARMRSAGYSFTGSWAWGENIAWASLRGAPGYNDEVELLHTNLMNSPGHKANILNANYREIGLGFEVGAFTTVDSSGNPRTYQGAFITEDFAKSGSAVFLTGVAFDDKDGDHFYDPGEGLAGLTVTATSSGGTQYSATTEPAGGYDIALPAGNATTYTVTFSGANITSNTRQVTIGTQNVKADLIDPELGSSSPPSQPPPSIPPPAPPPPPPGQGQTITGNGSANTLQGTVGNDTIQGLGGSDFLYGNAGADDISGGSGNDRIYGGLGVDTLNGGSGSDIFAFDTALNGEVDNIVSFSHSADTIWLDRDVFTAFTGTGQIASSAFYAGAAAHDATDRIMYDSGSGDLIYDPDGTGPAAAVHFAHVGFGAGVTYTDFTVIA